MGIVDIVEDYLNVVCNDSSASKYPTIKYRYKGKRHITEKTQREILTIIRNTTHALVYSELNTLFKDAMLDKVTEITNESLWDDTDLSIFKHYFIALGIPYRRATNQTCNIMDYAIIKILQVFDKINEDGQPLTILRLKKYDDELDYWFNAIGV